MNTSGIFITAPHIDALEKEDREKLFSILLKFPKEPGTDALAVKKTATLDEAQIEDEHFAELSPGQAREFYQGCGTKTKKAIEAIASAPARKFNLADVAKALNVSAPELRGVWGGLTRRLQTVTGDSGAYLIDWTKSDPVFDDDGLYIDQIGEITELTYNSLRKVLGRP